ncbi:MAG: L-seryl-tRNA(Sec) selenium transferase, partial [Candidatus Brocadia sp.]
MQKDILRSIPSVNELLESPEISKLTDIYPRLLVVDTIREVLEGIREFLMNKKGVSRYGGDQKTPLSSPPCEGGGIGVVKKIVEAQAIDLSPQRLYHLVQQSIQQKFCGIEHAINATGIILHTGLGRA